MLLLLEMKSNSLFSSLLTLGFTVKFSGYLEHQDKPFCTNCYSKSPGLMKIGKGKFEAKSLSCDSEL